MVVGFFSFLGGRLIFFVCVCVCGGGFAYLINYLMFVFKLGGL